MRSLKKLTMHTSTTMLLLPPLYGGLFKEVHFSKHLLTVDQDSTYIITAGNVMWETGEWSMTFQGQTGGPTQAKGNWSAIFRREGETWKKRTLMVAEEKIP